MPDNNELTELEAMVSELDDDMAGYPQPQAQPAGQQKYWPWVAVGGVVCGPKGVAILPKGAAPQAQPVQAQAAPAPKPPVVAAPPAAPPMGKLEMELEETRKKLSDIEEKMKTSEEDKIKKDAEAKKKEDDMSAQIADLKKACDSKDEEIKKLKSGKKLSHDGSGSTDLSRRESFEDTVFGAFGTKPKGA